MSGVAWNREAIHRGLAPLTEAAVPGARSTQAPRGEPSLRNVLVVEDDPKLGSLVLRGFAAQGVAGRLATTGDEALRLLKQGTDIDAVVLDVRLAHPDGIEVCRQARRDRFTGPIVVVSAHEGSSQRERALAAGADRYVGKPFELAALVALVRELAERPVPSTFASGDEP